MEQAVRLIYFLAESPDQLCSRLLQRSARLLLEQVTDGGEPNQSQVQEAGSQGSEEQGGHKVFYAVRLVQCVLEASVTNLILMILFFALVSCSSLAQVLSLCGAVAFWQVFHLERSVSTELRRRRGEREEKEEKEKAPANKTKVCGSHDVSMVVCL